MEVSISSLKVLPLPSQYLYLERLHGNVLVPGMWFCSLYVQASDMPLL